MRSFEHGSAATHYTSPDQLPFEQPLVWPADSNLSLSIKTRHNGALDSDTNTSIRSSKQLYSGVVLADGALRVTDDSVLHHPGLDGLQDGARNQVYDVVGPSMEASVYEMYDLL